MKKLRLITLFVIALAALLPLSALASATSTTSPVYSFADGSVKGASTLVRNKNRVSATLQTSGLDAGAAYTVWWVIFNLPENCSDPCNLDDIFVNGDPEQGMNWLAIEEAQISLLWAAGHVIGNNGIGNFGASLSEGKATGELLFGPGLVDAQTAEIHLVARTHGSPIPGQIKAQIHTFGGGCEVNFCEDQQYSIHLP
jgi:hypothetical protein